MMTQPLPIYLVSVVMISNRFPVILLPNHMVTITKSHTKLQTCLQTHASKTLRWRLAWRGKKVCILNIYRIIAAEQCEREWKAIAVLI